MVTKNHLSFSTLLSVVIMTTTTYVDSFSLTAASTRSSSPTQLLAASTMMIDRSNDKMFESVDFAHFTPLSCKASPDIMSAAGFFTQISLRRMRLEELNMELMQVAGDAAATKSLLECYKDYLLEPLEDLEAFLDPASVYTHDMSRQERYNIFQKTTDQRLMALQNHFDHHWALKSIRDYVLSFE